MIYISSRKSPSFILRHGFTETVGYRNITRKPIRLKFQEAQGSFYSEQLNTPDGMAKGWLNTKDAVKDINKQFLVWANFRKQDAETITPEEIEDFLNHHPKYGVEFVKLNDPSSPDYSPDEATTETLIVEADRPGYSHYCKACNEYFKNAQGARGHAKLSKRHRDNARHYQVEFPDNPI